MKTFQEFLNESASYWVQKVRQEIPNFNENTPWGAISAALSKLNAPEDAVAAMRKMFGDRK